MFYARIIATGEVLGGAWSAEQDADFLVRYAEALGVNGPLEMFESEDDPRTPGAPVEDKPEPSTPQPTIEDIIAVLTPEQRARLRRA